MMGRCGWGGNFRYQLVMAPGPIGTRRSARFREMIGNKPVQFKKNPGTPAYMSPEQLSGQPIDQRVDVFAFGVSAYELLTNQKPFPGESSAEILRAQVDHSSFVEPRQLNPDLPANLEKVVLKCLEREPDKRYPFLSVLVRDL